MISELSIMESQVGRRCHLVFKTPRSFHWESSWDLHWEITAGEFCFLGVLLGFVLLFWSWDYWTHNPQDFLIYTFWACIYRDRAQWGRHIHIHMMCCLYSAYVCIYTYVYMCAHIFLNFYDFKLEASEIEKDKTPDAWKSYF